MSCFHPGVHEFVRAGLAASAPGVAEDPAAPRAGCSHGAVLQHLPCTVHLDQAEPAPVCTGAAGQPHGSGKPGSLCFYGQIKKEQE